MTKIIFLAVLALSSFGAFASEVRHSLDYNIRSFHLDRCYAECTKSYNENNAGATLTLDSGRNVGMFVGTLRNSFDKRSFYGGINPYFDHTFKAAPITLRTGLLLGAVNGYADTPTKNTFAEDGDWAPVVSPNMSIYFKRFHANLGMLPSADTAVVTFRAGFSF